jgi:hypothetical protein
VNCQKVVYTLTFPPITKNVTRAFKRQTALVRHAFPFLIFLILLLVDLPGRAQPPANSSPSFESLKGKLPMPVDRFTNLNTYEQWLKRYKEGTLLGCGGDGKRLTIQSDSIMTVKNVAAGKVISIFQYDDLYALVVNQGKYVFMYPNLDTVFVKKDEIITAGQRIGKILTKSYDGLYELELMMSKTGPDKPESIDPYPWFAHSQYF